MTTLDEDEIRRFERFNAMNERVVRPEAIELVPNAYRLKVFTYLIDVGFGLLPDPWFVSTMELFDRVAGRPAQTYSSNLRKIKTWRLHAAFSLSK